jgi:hypothetical protein
MLVGNCTLKRLSGREEKGLAHRTPGGTFSAITTSWPRSPCTGLLAGEGAQFRTVGREGKGLAHLVVRSLRSPRLDSGHHVLALRGRSRRRGWWRMSHDALPPPAMAARSVSSCPRSRSRCFKWQRRAATSSDGGPTRFRFARSR